ncbi:hypothetical protein T07_6444 [Trichinella nelsoni]|uniref:Uncharacterized protein n=1 Tax=Trichinella nelsoni TaxID=6336 RepID=A0A0V0RKT9_9BILA|nr:hypothetical protein T07_6444 [Trichinella nelsoni]
MQTSIAIANSQLFARCVVNKKLKFFSAYFGIFYNFCGLKYEKLSIQFTSELTFRSGCFWCHVAEFKWCLVSKWTMNDRLLIVKQAIVKVEVLTVFELLNELTIIFYCIKENAQKPQI